MSFGTYAAMDPMPMAWGFSGGFGSIHREPLPAVRRGVNQPVRGPIKEKK
jgi:hypothetical protein